MDRLAWSGARTRFPFAALSIALALTGCGDDDTPTTDAGPGDSGMVINLDGGTDSGTPQVDGGPGVDAGNPNACRGYGADCTGERPCIGRGLECQQEINYPLAGGETVRDLPAGAETMGTYFQGGYCTPAPIAMTPLCDPASETDPTCGECGRCVGLGGNAAMCLGNCEPTGNDNSTCRDGSQCDLGLEVCVPLGCTTDEECRIEREDENGIDGLQAPDDCMEDPNVCDADCYCGEVFCGEDAMDDCDCGMIAECTGDAMNFDPLVYNDDPALGCNMDTFECRRPGRDGAEAGDPCTGADDCETGGRCLDEARFDAFEGGYCIKDRCDLPGRECAGDGVCITLPLGGGNELITCLEGCTIGDGADPMDRSTWLGNNGSCDNDYQACQWDSDANSGYCFPGNHNDVTEPNIGAACEDSEDCWSPFGVGVCAASEPGGFWPEAGYCTFFNCAAPGMPANACGDDASCVDVGMGTSICFDDCASNTDCRDGFTCGPIIMGSTDTYCIPAM